MKIIESPRIPSFTSEEGIYVVLPMRDKTWLDSIVRIKNGMIAWKFSPQENKSDSYFVQKPNQELYFFSKKEIFFQCLMKIYPEDFEFFLWHDEVHNGQYHPSDGSKEW